MGEAQDVYLEAGKLIVFSTGEYSDFGYRGMYVTLQPLLRSRLNEIADETTAEHKRLDAEDDAAWDAWQATAEAERGGPPGGVPGLHELFQTNLIKAGLLLIVDLQELHIGGYGELELGL